MITLTTQQTPTKTSEEFKSSLVLMDMLKAIGQCKITKEANDSEIHPLLTKAFFEAQRQRAELRDYTIEVYLRNLFYVFSIQRQHNIWKDENISSPEMGAQMRSVGRSITRWLGDHMSDWLYARDKDGYLYNLNLLVEFCNYDLLTHNQITTRTITGKTGSYGNKKTPNKIVAHETMNISIDMVAEIIVQNYRANRGRALIARWMPKYFNSKERVTTLVVGQDIMRKEFDCTGKDWVKINGNKYLNENLSPQGKWVLPIKDGDKVTYPKAIQPKTQERIGKDNELIFKFNSLMGWDMPQYNAFRKEYMEKTPESLFSTGDIVRMKRDEFLEWVGGLTAGQQWVVSRTLCYKDPSGILAPRPTGKFINTDLPKWYIEFANIDAKKATEVRAAMSTGDTIKVKQLQKEIKTKVTGLQTIDLMIEMMTGNKSELEINTLHTSITSKMDMHVPIYCILDGSASMTNPWRNEKGVVLRFLDIALTLGLTFMLTNPIEEYRNSCMWFGSETEFTGVTKYANTAPNQWLTGPAYNKTTGARRIVDPSKTFTENIRSLSQANPGKYTRTNAGAVVETFMSLVSKGVMVVEELPRVLLFITDEEYNTGKEPVTPDGKGFTQIGNTIGWNPLFVFWGIKTTAGLDKYSNAPNCMVTRGFNENNLTQILQFIRKGAINIYDELFSVHEMPGLQPVTYPFIK